MDRVDDRELLHRWGQGDREAGAALFDRHFDSLYRFFRTKADEAADDLVQQAFLACVEARERFRGEATFRTFMFQIARHQLYAHYQRRKRAAAVDFGLSSVRDLGTSPSAVVARREQGRLLLAALQELPVDTQIALELCYFEGLSRAQIAEVLNVSEGTVASRIRRGRERLGEKLGESIGVGEPVGPLALGTEHLGELLDSRGPDDSQVR